MLSSQARLKVEFLCKRIEQGQPVELNEMLWLDKWASRHRTVRDMVSRARRRAINGMPERGTIDELLDGLNLGLSDPSSHLTGTSSVDDIAAFFKNDDEGDRERLRRD